MQAAASEDYGQDYEHLLVSADKCYMHCLGRVVEPFSYPILLQLLQNKFDDLKHRVEAGADRFNQCEGLAKKLIAGESPHSSVIEKRQEQLRY